MSNRDLSDEVKIIFEEHRKWLSGEGGKRADLREHELCHKRLRAINLQKADLRGINFNGAYMKFANLRFADLRGAKLNKAYLWHADLRGSDLRGAKLDFSCEQIYGGSKGSIIDLEIASELAARFCSLICDEPEFLEAKAALLPLAQKSPNAEYLLNEKLIFRGA